MYCKECGKSLPENSLVCDNCGSATGNAVKTVTEKQNKNNKLIYGAIPSFIMSAIFFIMGLYKMFAYKNMDSYPYTHINAYVGGDAYNYIINGTYSTAYFVLSMGLLVFGILLLIYGELKLRRE